MENLAIYEVLRNVPQEAQKSFSNGRFSGTDINPMWRIKKLTETFGACGVGWYVEVVNREFVKSDNGEVAAFVSVNLFVKHEGEWSKPIYGEGGNMFVKNTKSGVSISDEAYKMAYTDAISNASKMLGLGADIWFANDRTKYTEERRESLEQNIETIREQVIGFLAGNSNAVDFYCHRYNASTIDSFNDTQYREIYKELKRNGRI